MSDVLSWIREPGIQIIGHRGFPHAARENTLVGFEAALEAGCDGVELDVHVTADGIPVVHHDAGIRGPEGDWNLPDRTWPDLDGVRFSAAGTTYPLHRLVEVLDSLRGRCLINVELKPAAPDRRTGVVDAVLPVLDRVRPRESLLVSSFDPDLLAAMLRRDKSILLGYLFSSGRELNHLEEYEIVDALTALHPRHDLVNPALVKRAGERGLAVNTWTVDDVAEAARVADLGVQSIITNRPDTLVHAIPGP